MLQSLVLQLILSVSLRYSLQCRTKDRTRTQLQRLASFLQATQPFFQQLQPEVIRDVCSCDHLRSLLYTCAYSSHTTIDLILALALHQMLQGSCMPLRDC